MAKLSKEMEYRIGGMMYALNIAKSGGIEALEKEVKMRGLTKLSVNAKSEEIYNQWKEVTENIYNNMITCALYSLHECFGFGQDRLKKFKEYYDKAVIDATDLDYMGEHYVHMSDYAKELNDKYDVKIDVDTIIKTEREFDESNPRYHMAKAERLIEVIRIYGDDKTADRLQRYLDIDLAC